MEEKSKYGMFGRIKKKKKKDGEDFHSKFRSGFNGTSELEESAKMQEKIQDEKRKKKGGKSRFQRIKDLF